MKLLRCWLHDDECDTMTLVKQVVIDAEAEDIEILISTKGGGAIHEKALRDMPQFPGSNSL